MATLKRHKSSEGEESSASSAVCTPRSSFETPSPRNHSNKENYAKAIARRLCSPDLLEILQNRAALVRNFPAVNSYGLERCKSERMVLVDGIFAVIETVKLNRTAAATAISYLDRVLSCSRVHSQEYILIAAACVHLAVTVEAHHKEAPDLQTLLLAFRQVFRDSEPAHLRMLTYDHMLDTSAVVLQNLEFRLYPLTAAHFLETLIELRLLSGSKHVPERDERKLDQELGEFAWFLCDLSMQHARFQGLNSVEMTLVVVASARRGMRCSTERPKHLEELFGVEFDSRLEAFYIDLFGVYEREYLSSRCADADENLRPDINKHIVTASMLDESPAGVADVGNKNRKKNVSENGHS